MDRTENRLELAGMTENGRNIKMSKTNDFSVNFLFDLMDMGIEHGQNIIGKHGDVVDRRREASQVITVFADGYEERCHIDD